MPYHKNIKVIISDLDGTLLDPTHSITNYTKSIFNRLHEQGYLIIVATGRHHLDAMAIVKNLDFPIYLVTSNGARIHAPNQELIYSKDIKSEKIKAILDLDIDSDISSIIFKEDFWFTSKTNEKLNAFQKEMSYPPKLVDYKTLDDFSGIKLFFNNDSHDKLLALHKLIQENNTTDLVSAFSLPTCLEFMDKNVDKSIAIAKILELEGYTFDQTISFGDGFNDEKMLLQTKIGLIMDNAVDSLKTKLSHLKVIASNNDDGVAHYLFENFLKKEKVS